MSRVRFALAALAVGALAPVTHAQLSNDALGAFNTAVQSGDNDAIISASTALMDNAIANPSDPNATVAAYEAALKLCERQACETALRGAEFTTRQPDTNSHPLMSDRELLRAYAEFAIDSDGSSRRGLREALEAVRDRDPSYLSMRAGHALYSEFVRRGDWRDAWRIASAEADHLYPVRSVVSEAYYGARQNAAVSFFYSEQTRESHELIARWNAETAQAISQVVDAGYAAPEWLESNYWQSEALLRLADYWFYSYDTDNSLASMRAQGRRIQPMTEAQRERVYAEYPLSIPEELFFFSIPEDQLPRCRGELIQEPELEYPNSITNFWAGVGVVYTKLFFEEDGTVSDVELLASIPASSDFEEDTLETARQWRFEVAEDQERENCRLSLYPFVYNVAFYLRRN